MVRVTENLRNDDSAGVGFAAGQTTEVQTTQEHGNG